MASAPVTRPLDPAWMERQLILRDWSMGDLAEKARLNHSTAARARKGEHVDAGTLRKIAAAFRAYPPDPSLAEIAEGVR